MRIVGVDYGDTRTGLAVSDPTARLAGPAGTVTASDPELAAQRIAQRVRELDGGLIVLGLPRHMNGDEGERAAKARSLGERLRQLTGLEVVLFDERCTTVLSHAYFNEANIRGKKRKAAVDTQSACIILQNYLDSVNR